MPNQNSCLVCLTSAAVTDKGSTIEVICNRCGKYSISPLAKHGLSNYSDQSRANLSGWLSENPNSSLTTKDISELAVLKTPSVGEKADKVLSFFATSAPIPGLEIRPDLNLSLTFFEERNENTININANALMAHSWCWNEYELGYILRDYLKKECAYLSSPSSNSYIITPKGWMHLHSIKHGKRSSSLAFIAMWFSNEVDEAHKAFEEAIKLAGYAPLRIDQLLHNNKIDDEILAAIRRSRFVVADFTGHRGGVYFEAGFALGLGIPVIWLCRQDHLEKVHFDNRQYNF